MERFSRYLFLSVLGVGVFSVIISGFFDVVEGQPFQGLAMIFIGTGVSHLIATICVPADRGPQKPTPRSTTGTPTATRPVE